MTKKENVIVSKLLKIAANQFLDNPSNEVFKEIQQLLTPNELIQLKKE